MFDFLILFYQSEGESKEKIAQRQGIKIENKKVHLNNFPTINYKVSFKDT